MRVLVVDDHEELLDLVATSLVRDGHLVTRARTTGEARHAIEQETFDVIVLDIGLPDGSGVDLCRGLREAEISTPILFLTARSGVAARVGGLDAGGDDFLGKPFAVAELRARVRALGRRRGLPAALSWTGAGVALDFSRRRASVALVEIPLTAKEWRILEVLASARGRVVARSRILEEVWGDDRSSAAASLDVLMARIRKKLGNEVVRTARGEGYALA